MHPELIHLYGPFSINSFGAFLVVGLVVFSILMLKDPKRPRLISTDHYFNALSLAILVGLLGARALYVISNLETFQSPREYFALWNGGFSLLGGIVAVLAIMPWYFKKNNIPTLKLLDLAAIYAPLLQAIARLGCFCAGCCYPTQIQSALSLFAIFLVMYFVLQNFFKKTGQLLCAYLVLMSMERFIVDFWRGDREYTRFSFLGTLSIAQLVALAIGGIASIFLLHSTLLNRHKRS